MNRWVCIVAVVVLAGCGGDGSGRDDQDDLGQAGTSGRGGSGGGPKGRGLEINAALGLDLIDRPFENESNVGGVVLIQRNGEDTVGGEVTVNGTAFAPEPLLTGFFSANGATIPNTGAGKPLVVRASDAEGSASLELPCPDEVAVTSPKQGTVVRGGDTIEVRWSGDVHKHNLEFVIAPGINFLRKSDFNGRWGQVGVGQTIPKGQKSVEVIIPDADAGEALVLELAVPGEFKTVSNGAGGDHAGACWLKRRVELKYAD